MINRQFFDMNILKCLMILVWLSAPALANAAGGAVVSFNSGEEITVSSNESREAIPLSIDGIPDLGADDGVGAFTIRIRWDADVVTVHDVTPATPGAFTILAGEPDNARGELIIAGFSMGSCLGGSETVATLGIKAANKKDVSTPINVGVVSLGDKTGRAIKAAGVGAKINIRAAPPSGVLYIDADSSGNCAGKHPCHVSIQEGIDAGAVKATLRIMGGLHHEALAIDDARVITLHGGWDATFTKSTPANPSIISSPTPTRPTLTIRGKVVIHHVELR